MSAFHTLVLTACGPLAQFSQSYTGSGVVPVGVGAWGPQIFSKDEKLFFCKKRLAQVFEWGISTPKHIRVE